MNLDNPISSIFGEHRIHDLRHYCSHARVRAALRRDGWQVLVIWECQLRKSKLPRTMERLRRFLEELPRPKAKSRAFPVTRTGRPRSGYTHWAGLGRSALMRSCWDWVPSKLKRTLSSLIWAWR